MSSKGRKIAKNLGKSLRKKFDSDSQTDDLQQQMTDLNLSRSSPTHSTASARSADMRSSGAAAPAPSMGKSTSMSTMVNDPSEPVIVDHNEIIALTHDVKNFSDTLNNMKLLFMEGLEPGDDARVVLQDTLGGVLAVLKDTLQHYPALQSPEIFTTARALISKIRSHSQEELNLEEEELQLFLDAIDQVALAFSRSVSEYLMGDIVTQQTMNTETKVKSCDNIAKAAQEEGQVAEKQEPKKALTTAELDAILVGLEAGLDLALQRAKAWSRYTRDVITYIEKKSQLEMEYAKNLARIANSMQPVLTTEGFLPLQSVFCTALSQDSDFSSSLQASQAMLHTPKFLEPLVARRSEHDRVRKAVKESWDRELRKMQDTVNNLRKAQALYISRQQELERIRETVQKAEGDKMEKRKKSEEEAMNKSAEAETTYKACVAEANHRQRSLEKVKVELLGKIREQIHMCDQVIKSVTVEYFSLLHAVWSPVPVQYQTLCESSDGYEAGCQYAEFIKSLPSSASKPCRTEEFAFEPYTPGQKAGEARKVSIHSNGSSGEHIHSNEGSPVSSSRRDKHRAPVKAWGQNSSQPAAAACGSDTDSASGSNKSHESSPSSSPHDLLRRQLVTSQSLEELTEEDADRLPMTAQQKRGQMKRTNTVGGDDTLELPTLNQRGRRNTMFGVDFQEQVDRYKSQVPPIITQCLAEIERRGVMIKGIYRVSGVKSKVENLCQRFDLNPELVDLEEVHPNIISNVLKLYLRQLPEPLLTFRLYSDFIHTAKENMAGSLLGDKIVERLMSLVRKLPPSNFRTCAVLMHHLHRVAAHSDLNQMSSSNLGIVFGPTLLRPLEGTASLASLVDTPHQTRAIELLIVNAETVFGPGDDYQLLPDQTPVEAMEEAAEVPSSSSEPSPEKSPTKITTDAFPTPPSPRPSSINTAVTTSSSSSLPSSAVAPAAVSAVAPLASQVEDSVVLVADPVGTTPSLEPSAADFSLPGSATASQDRDDNVFLDNSTGIPGHGRGMNSDSDDASLSTLDDDDDDFTETMLPDQSHGPNSHTPLLTPHCIAESKTVVKDGAESKAGVATGTTTDPQRAPLADMEPAPDTTIPAPQPPSATVDSSTWPARSGSAAGVTVPPSPIVNPLGTPSPTSSTSSFSDGRLSPTKGDNRADRFRLEQRKLLCAIKSDPKLGIAGEEGEVGMSLEGEDAVDSVTGEDNKGEASAGDSQKPDLSVVSGHLTPQLLRKVGAMASSVATGKEGTKDAALAESGAGSVNTSEKEKGEAQGNKAEVEDAGTKVPGSPARSGIRLGTRSSSPRTELSATRSGLHPTGGRYSALCSSSKTRSNPTTTTAAVQRRSNITGLNGSNSPVPTTSSPSAPSRTVMSRYPPATSSPTLSTSSPSRRPISSQAPTSTVLSRSSSGSSTGSSPRRPASTAASPLRHSFESSLRSSSTAGPTDTSGVRTRRASGEKGGVSGVGRSSSGLSGGKNSAGSDGTVTTKAGAMGGGAGSSATSTSRTSAVGRTASTGARNSTGSITGISKSASSAGTTTKTAPVLSGSNTSSAGATTKTAPVGTNPSSAGTTTKTAPVLSGANTSSAGATTKAAPVLSGSAASSVSGATGAAKTATGTPSLGAASESGAGVTGGGGEGVSQPAAASSVGEKSVERRSSERNTKSQPRPARDFSSDRTPRFV
ncbi:rho GTPase-activating protein 45-like isoform X3 [Littorina saxatilis]|uniref:rho GTPase-activating protein 45-like isoform X3 n=1 Tax=Littorina saxatilis TaxID=31220 RepID=UPI0038B50E61